MSENNIIKREDDHNETISISDTSYIGSVCFIGSMKFWDDMLIEAERIYREGKVVVLPIKDTRSEIPKEDLKIYDKVIRAAIKMCDSVHVINKGGYIGKSTRGEIEFAKAEGKPITYLEEPIRIVTLCGSFKFTDTFNKLNASFTKCGILTFLPAFLNINNRSIATSLTSNQIDNLHQIHYMKIDMSDAILVVDIDMIGTEHCAYVGEDTLREIEYASSKGKEIIYLSKFKSMEAIIGYINNLPK